MHAAGEALESQAPQASAHRHLTIVLNGDALASTHSAPHSQRHHAHGQTQGATATLHRSTCLVSSRAQKCARSCLLPFAPRGPILYRRGGLSQAESWTLESAPILHRSSSFCMVKARVRDLDFECLFLWFLYDFPPNQARGRLNTYR